MLIMPCAVQMKSRFIFFGLMLLIAVLYSEGCRRAGSWLIKGNVLGHTDVIVILMGSFPERVLQALDLYNNGMSDRIVIVEESMGPYRSLEERGVRIETNSEQAVRSLITLGVPADSITLLPGDARSTLDEAVAVRDFFDHKPEADTLILVSSPAHMRRAALIFNRALRYQPVPVTIGCSPSSYSGFNPDKWWRRKEDIQSVMSEYLKICSFLLFEKRELKR